MANYDFTYTGQEIQAILDTGQKLKDAGYIFLGIATPSTNPGTPTQKVYYEAKEAGTYSNFGGAVLLAGIHLLMWNGSWSTKTLYLSDDNICDSHGAHPIRIPDYAKDNRLLINNEYATAVSGYYSVKNLDISKFEILIFYTIAMGTNYSHLWLTDNNGNVTTVDFEGNTIIPIDNSNGQYSYISFNCRENWTMLYSVEQTDEKSAVEVLNEQVSSLKKYSNVSTKRYTNILRDSDIITEGYINARGAITPATGYSSVLLYPVANYDSFIVSGNTTSTSIYIKTYNANFEEIGSYQGLRVFFDNSEHSIAYVSFTSKDSQTDIYLKALDDVSIRESASVETETYQGVVFKDSDWRNNVYVNDSNELVSVSETESYHYKAIHNYYVGNAKKIQWCLFFGGNARVVTLDGQGNVISSYQRDNYELDNTDGTIKFISFSNNFVAKEYPSFMLLRTPLVNEVALGVVKQQQIVSPLKGKNIAVLGDSIMAKMAQDGISTSGTVTYVGTDGITYSLSELTNIGGLLYVTSTLDDGQIVSTTIQADVHNANQSDMNIESWIPLQQALEANYIINTGRGGATITGNVITTAYPNGQQTTFNTMPNHCLELKRRVDAGEPSPDVIMIWAGTNDVRKFVVDNQWVEPTNFDEIMSLDYTTQLLADTDAAMNYKKTFYGGLRFCMEYLYRNFQNALVVLFSPIPSVVSPRTYERERLVGSYIKRMAERYSAIFVDACVEMGITDIFDTETSHRWLRDGLHPNDAGKVLYCNYTAKKLNEICFSKI